MKRKKKNTVKNEVDSKEENIKNVIYINGQCVYELENDIKKEKKKDNNVLYYKLVQFKCENYYILNSHIDINNEQCDICLKRLFTYNDILYFESFDVFLSYITFAYVYMDNMLKYNEKNFYMNKEEVLSFYEKYFNNEKEKISQRAKRVCKFCILHYMNKEHSLNLFIKLFTKTNNTIIIPKDNISLEEKKVTKIKIPIGEVNNNNINNNQIPYEQQQSMNYPQQFVNNPQVNLFNMPIPSFDNEHHKFFYQLMNNNLLSSITHNSQLLNALNIKNDNIYNYLSINTEEIEFNIQNEINQLNNMSLELQSIIENPIIFMRTKYMIHLFFSSMNESVFQEEKNYLEKKRDEYINEWNTLTENILQYRQMIINNKILLQETLNNIQIQKDIQKIHFYNHNNNFGNS